MLKTIKTAGQLFLLSAGISILVVGCADDQGNQTTAEVDDTTASDSIPGEVVSGNIVKYQGEIFSIPSPIQTAIMIRNSGIEYNDGLLNPISNSANYVNQYQKALNMGVYGADLAYLSNFDNTSLSIEYFTTIDQIADELGIKSNLDPSLVARFKQNVDIVDSLYVLNAELYRQVNEYLKENERNEAATLILAGGWLEALHLSLDAVNTSDAFRSRIGEQRSALNSLVTLLGSYDDEQVKSVQEQLASLKKVFDGLTRSYTYEKPITDTNDKKTYLNGRSQVEVNDEQLNEIRNQVAAIRNTIIN